MKRKQRIQKPRNFFPTLIITILLWFAQLMYVLIIPPTTIFSITGLLTLFFVSTLFTGSIILKNTRRGLIFSLGLSFFLVLRIIGLGNLLNLSLLAGFLITIEIYATRR